MKSRFLHLLLALMLLLTGLDAAHAKRRLDLTEYDQVVGRQDVVNAIRSARGVNSLLYENAEAIAALAVLESGGHTSVYNGICCYGILQLHTMNMPRHAGTSNPEVYRNMSLQQQVNAWVSLTVEAQQHWSFQNLLRRAGRGETFDGQPIDWALLQACTQLGQGNCGDMVRAGKCSGFKGDANGVNICDMANGIRRRMGQQTYPTGGDSPLAVRPVATFECRRNADGSCMSVSEAMRAAFREGSGVDMETLRKVIRMLLMSTALLAAGSGTLTAWQSYAKGAIAQPAMIGYVKRATLLTLTVVVILSVM